MEIVIGAALVGIGTSVITHIYRTHWIFALEVVVVAFLMIVLRFYAYPNIDFVTISFSIIANASVLCANHGILMKTKPILRPAEHMAMIAMYGIYAAMVGLKI